MKLQRCMPKPTLSSFLQHNWTFAHPLPCLQADDDSYVRMDRLLTRIQEAPNSRMFMGAIENPGGGPHRDPRSQWYVTPEEWPSERYPPWAHGAGYVLSQVYAYPGVPISTRGLQKGIPCDRKFCEAARGGNGGRGGSGVLLHGSASGNSRDVAHS